MNRPRGFQFQIDLERSQGIARQGKWRFILLIFVFNVLLITTLLLSMQQRELVREQRWLVETRVVIQELLITQEMIKPVTVTVVVTPGFVPQATSAGP
jgi:hypothetical protein